MKVLGLLLAGMCGLAGFVAPSARAQETTAPAAATTSEETAPPVVSPWSFRLTTYLWLAGLEGDIGVKGLGPVDVDASFSDIFKNIDWTPPPVMFSGEVRYDRFAFVTDFVYLGLEGDGASPGPLPITANVDTNTIIWTFGGAYRVFEDDTFALDAMVGGRLWNFDADLTLAVPGAAVQRDDSKTWVDPIIGLRGFVNFGDGFGLRVEGDVGGFGLVADIDWEVTGALEYRISDLVALDAGYRYLAADYKNGGFVFDAAMSGPIIGATFRF